MATQKLTKKILRKASIEDRPLTGEEMFNIIKPPKESKSWVMVLFTIIQWLVIAAVIFFIFRDFHYRIPETRPMPGYLVILFGLSAAYVWVDVLKWGVTKPFNCLTCMTGWICLALAFAFHTHYWYLYLPLGAFVGGLYSSVKMRFL